MKTTSIIACAILFAASASAQKVSKQDVPAVVTSAFGKAYPNAEEAEWEKENGNYEVEFETKEEEMSVVYDASGNLMETEIEIQVVDLPKPVAEYVNKNYSGKKIKEAAKITNAKGVITYEAEVGGSDLMFDSNGKFIKIETEDEKDGKDEKNK